MASSGYSGTPLIKKLGISETSKISVINAPANYFELLEKNLEGQFVKKGDPVDLVHLFVTSQKEFEREMRKLSPLHAQIHRWSYG